MTLIGIGTIGDVTLMIIKFRSQILQVHDGRCMSGYLGDIISRFDYFY